MTKEEARIVLLEDSLIQAQFVVEFLHNCLINSVEEGGIYKYINPERTEEFLSYWGKIVGEKREPCFHSMNDVSCEACKERVKYVKRLTEAKKVLNISL